MIESVSVIVGVLCHSTGTSSGGLPIFHFQCIFTDKEMNAKRCALRSTGEADGKKQGEVCATA